MNVMSGVVVEVAQQLGVDAELVGQTAMRGAEPIEAVAESSEIFSGTGDLVAELIEQPVNNFLASNRLLGQPQLLKSGVDELHEPGNAVGGRGHRPQPTAARAISAASSALPIYVRL
jgi:hypothetical protein